LFSGSLTSNCTFLWTEYWK